MSFLTKRASSSLAAVAASVALAAGCGGDDSNEAASGAEEDFVVRASTTVTTGPLDRPRFVNEVNKFCREGWEVILENFDQYSGWQEEDGLGEDEAFTKSVRLSFLAGFDFHIFDLIYRLGGPKGEEKDVEEVIGELQRAVELGQRRIAISSPEQLTSHFARYNRLARDYGLVDCLVDGQRVKDSQRPNV